MSVVVLKATTQRKWHVMGLCTLVVLVIYLAHLTFYDANRLWVTEAIDQQGNPPWWEADDCQCESPECGKPSLTFRRLNKEETGGTCGRKAWAAGDGQRVLSFSLYGNNTDYWKGLALILPEVENLYPEWKVRLYTDPRDHTDFLSPLLHRYPSLLYVCDITSLPPPLCNLSNVHPMMWRVAPLGDPQVAIMAVRDTDSMVSQREAEAVQDWLASGKAFHVMRDHPYHVKPVMGGMWGARWDGETSMTASKMRALRNKMISLAAKKKSYGDDQIIFKEVLWPAMAGRVMAHDSYTCRQFKGSSPWPTRRTDKNFVGSRRLRKQYENRTIPKPCPKSCRPPGRPDWLYC